MASDSDKYPLHSAFHRDRRQIIYNTLEEGILHLLLSGDVTSGSPASHHFDIFRNSALHFPFIYCSVIHTYTTYEVFILDFILTLSPRILSYLIKYIIWVRTCGLDLGRGGQC